MSLSNNNSHNYTAVQMIYTAHTLCAPLHSAYYATWTCCRRPLPTRMRPVSKMHMHVHSGYNRSAWLRLPTLNIQLKYALYIEGILHYTAAHHMHSSTVFVWLW